MNKLITDSMNNLSTLKTVLTILIGGTVATSFVILPVLKSEENLATKTTNAELISNQNLDQRSQRPSKVEAQDNFNNIVGLTGLAIGTGVIGYHLTRAYKPSLANSVPSANNRSTALLTRVSPKLRRELLRLLHDQQTANRLLSGTLNSHPGRSANWLAEKVIYDLKRDR